MILKTGHNQSNRHPEAEVIQIEKKWTPSRAKVMARVFWAAQGILPVDYLEGKEQVQAFSKMKKTKHKKSIPFNPLITQSDESWMST